MAQIVKNLPAMQETQVRFLGWEDPLEKGKATYTSILAWKIPWMEEPGIGVCISPFPRGLQAVQEVISRPCKP